jgi:hypothetical protein
VPPGVALPLGVGQGPAAPPLPFEYRLGSPPPAAQSRGPPGRLELLSPSAAAAPKKSQADLQAASDAARAAIQVPFERVMANNAAAAEEEARIAAESQRQAEEIARAGLSDEERAKLDEYERIARGETATAQAGPAEPPNSLAVAEAEAQARAAAAAAAAAAANSERRELDGEEDMEAAAAQAALLGSATGLDLEEGRAAATPLPPSATLAESAKIVEAARKQLQESAARQAAVTAQLEALSAQRKAQAEPDALRPRGGKRRRRKHKTPRRPKKRQGRRARKSTFRRRRKH